MRRFTLLFATLLCVLGAKAQNSYEAATFTYSDDGATCTITNGTGGSINLDADQSDRAYASEIAKIKNNCTKVIINGQVTSIQAFQNNTNAPTYVDMSNATFVDWQGSATAGPGFTMFKNVQTAILPNNETSTSSQYFQNCNNLTTIRYKNIEATGSGSNFTFTKSGNETDDTYFENLLKANNKNVTVKEPAKPTEWDETTGTLTIGPDDDTSAKLKEFVQTYGADNIKKVVFPDGSVWENGKLTVEEANWNKRRNALSSAGLSVITYERKVGKYVSLVKETADGEQFVAVTNCVDNSNMDNWPGITDAEKTTLRFNNGNLKIVGSTSSEAFLAIASKCQRVYDLDLSETIITNPSQQLPGGWKSYVETLTLPNDPNFTAVPTQFFNDATQLTTLNVPSNILSIGKFAFNGCSSLASVNWADDCNVEELGPGCFQDCAFVNLTIPASVKYIRGDAFKGMTSLTTVTFPADSHCELVEAYAFTESDNITDVYVLCHIREAAKDANGNYYKDANGKEIKYYPYCTNYAFDFNTTVSQTVVGSVTGATLHLPDQESRDDFDFYVGNWKSGIIFTQDMLDALKGLKVNWNNETYEVLNGWQEFVRLSGEREIVVFDFLYKTYSDNQAHPLPTGILAFRATGCTYNKNNQTSTITLTKLPGIPANTGVILISTTKFVTYNNQKPGQFYLGNYSNVADEPQQYPWSTTGDINYLEPTIDTGLDVAPATYDDNAKVIDRYFGLARKKKEGVTESNQVNGWTYYFSRMKECQVKPNLAILRLPWNVWGGFIKNGKEVSGQEPLMFEGANGGPGVNPNEPGIDETTFNTANYSKVNIIFEGVDEDEMEGLVTAIEYYTNPSGIVDNSMLQNNSYSGFYNLQGEKVSETKPQTKGVYIHNGKKIVIK